MVGKLFTIYFNSFVYNNKFKGGRATESQSEQAQTMLMCLREIQRCNALIVARYGMNE
jgi:hypothetical protein